MQQTHNKFTRVVFGFYKNDFFHIPGNFSSANFGVAFIGQINFCCGSHQQNISPVNRVHPGISVNIARQVFIGYPEQSFFKTIVCFNNCVNKKVKTDCTAKQTVNVFKFFIGFK
jgi:hypothetical protein